MNISPQTVESLRRARWEAIRVSQLLPVDAADEEILDLARRERKVLITQDLEFSAFLALGGHADPSVITLRLSESDPATVTNRLLEVLPRVMAILDEGAVVIIEDAGIRIRHLPIE